MKFAAIVGTQRSGTTVTRAILDTHPDIATYGEVFLPRHAHMRDCYYHYLRDRCAERPFYAIPTEETQRALFRGYLKRLEDMSAPHPTAVLDCKTQFLYHALNLGGSKGSHPFLLTMMKEHGFGFIGIQRGNKLGMYVSQILSSQTRVWATETPEQIEDRTVHIPTHKLTERMLAMEEEDRQMVSILNRPNVNAVILKYEDFLGNPSCANADDLERIAELLDIANAFDPVPKYRKIGLPLRDAIRNFDEVVDVLGSHAKRFVDPYV